MIEIKSSSLNRTEVYIDGMRLEGVRELDFHAEVDEMPVLKLEMMPLEQNLTNKNKKKVKEDVSES